MNLHRYKVYYEFNGPTKADPLRTEKNKEQIADALDRVCFELSVYLDDQGARLSASPDSQNAIILTIETTQPDQVVTLSMKWCLNGLDLFATKL